MPNVSWFQKGEFSEVSGNVPMAEVIDKIRGGAWQDEVFQVRNGQIPKTKVKSFTPSGTFQERRAKGTLLKHSGFISIDIDNQDNEDLVAARPFLEADPYAFSVFQSIGGKGLVMLVKINPEKHLEAFEAFSQYLANEYEIFVDPSGKDVSRLRFVSYDPALYLNEKARKWTKALPKKEKQKTPRHFAYNDDDIGYIMEQIQTRGINLADSYDRWFKIGLAIADEYGEGGRNYFHTISSQSSKYDNDKCNKQYDVSLRRNEAGVSMGTLFFYCKEAGIEIQSGSTKEAEAVFKQRVKIDPSLSRKEAIASTVEFMEMRGASPGKIQQALERIKEVPTGLLKQEKISDKTLEIETFIRQFDLRYNDITLDLEYEGKQITDRDINGIYLKGMHAISDSISKEKIWSLMNSPIVPYYNPFLEYIDSIKELAPEGVFKQLVECCEVDDPEYFEYFLKRWLLGIISSMHGTHSVLMLVLCGPQGCGKTEFFRNLLPKELNPYYHEGRIGGSKDDDRLMTNNILIVDDEFESTSKKEAAKFKEVASKSSFKMRLPYGKAVVDLKRHAVLAGTSNDYEILVDMTGNRRIIPVNISALDIDKLKAIDKDDLFAELYHEWKKVGNGWMLSGEDIERLNDKSTKNELLSYEEDLIQKFFIPVEESDPTGKYLTNTDVVKLLDSVGSKSVTIVPKRVGMALKKYGYEKKKRMIRGRQALFYYLRPIIEETQMNDAFSEENEPDF